MLPQQDLTPPPPTATLPPAAGTPAAPAADATATPVPAVATPVPATAAPGTAVTATPAASPGTTGNSQGTVNLAGLAALLIYVVFFGIMGYRRGTQRELIVFVVALGMSFLLQRFTGAIITLFDRFGKGLAFVTGQPIPQQSGLGAWAEANTQTLLILIWLAVMVFTYVFSGQAVRKSKRDGWSVILGVLNGLILASVFAPLLTTLIFPTATIQGQVVQYPVLGFLSNIFGQIRALAANLWAAIEPVATNVFFLGVVLLILLAALTLRTSVKPKT